MSRWARTYHDHAFSVRVPNPHYARVSADQEITACLSPFRDQSSAALQAKNLIQAAEGADHLNRTAAEIWVVVAVQTNDTIS